MTDMNPKAILLMSLTEKELPDLPTFDCGSKETNNFLLNEAFGEQERGLNTTTLVYYNGILAAFLSLCCDSIHLNKEETGEAAIAVPAIKIRYAIDRRFKDYEGLDSFIIDYARNVAFELWTSKVGVRFLTLDADLSQESYFSQKGFVRNRSNDTGETISFRMDIFD